jgi:hypothetical protein
MARHRTRSGRAFQMQRLQARGQASSKQQATSNKHHVLVGSSLVLLCFSELDRMPLAQLTPTVNMKSADAALLSRL